MTDYLTWSELVELEPRLHALYLTIRTMRRDSRRKNRFFDVDAIWYDWSKGFKQELVQLVGHLSNHPDPRLRTSRAYRLAYDKLYRTLAAPDERPTARVGDGPISNSDLASMSFRDAMTWAADANGKLDSSRLIRIAEARGYKPGWVYLQGRKTLAEVLTQIESHERERGWAKSDSSNDD